MLGTLASMCGEKVSGGGVFRRAVAAEGGLFCHGK